MTQTQEIVFYDVNKDSDLLIGRFAKYAYIDLDIAKKIVADRLSVGRIGQQVWLVYGPKSTALANNAIGYMLSKKSRFGIKAMALLDSSKSRTYKLFVNFCLALFVRDSNLRIFNKEEEALKWLMKYKN